MNDQQAILDFQRLADKVTAPSKLEYWSGKADELAIKSGKPMVVVHSGEFWQVWNKSVCSKCGRDWEYCTDGDGE
jgi:hypothetical protein